MRLKQKKQFDLHLHSYYSDGNNSPEQILRRAKRAGLSIVAITDHNTLEHIQKTAKIAKKLRLKNIPGAEIGLNFKGKKFAFFGLLF